MNEMKNKNCFLNNYLCTAFKNSLKYDSSIIIKASGGKTQVKTNSGLSIHFDTSRALNNISRSFIAT